MPVRSSSTQRTYDLNSRLRVRLRVEELEGRTLLTAYTPAQILAAYGTNQIAFNGGTIKGDGAGQTIAIVDAYYDPSIQTDLATFSSKYGLTPLDGKNGDGTFKQIDLSNKKLSPAGDDWTVETALDVEWAHAVAPKANIVLVEAASDGQNALTGEPTDLLHAVQTAANTPGVSVVSMSWGIGEVPQETNWDSFFTKPGVTFVAASGDSGAGTIWPAVSPNVVSVGGTTLHVTGSNTISSETGWGYGTWSSYFGGSGGGFSTYEPLPAFQANSGISKTYTQFGARLSPDVAYNADPNTGYNVYDAAAGGWGVVGGTSAGAPQWAGLIAIADQGRALAKQAPLSSAQTLKALYANPSDFHDIKSGSTGAYYIVNNFGYIVGQIPVTAGTGYDLVTGLGTPIANLIVPALASAGVTAPAASVTPTVAPAAQSSSTGSKSKTLDVPANSAALSLAAQTSAIVAASNLARVPVFAAPAASPRVVVPAPTLLVGSDTGRAPSATLAPVVIDSGSSVDSSLPDSDNSTPKVMPAIPPDAPPVVEPPAPMPEQPSPNLNALDALFIQDESTKQPAVEATMFGLPGRADDLASLLAAVTVIGVALRPDASLKQSQRRALMCPSRARNAAT
jgi:subtilase family serine protease